MPHIDAIIHHVASVLSGDSKFYVACERAEAFCEALPDSSVNLICVDHPYNRVKKSEAWDNAWKDDAAFVDWTRGMLRRYQRILKPNGSLYVFASPGMCARVEVATRETFNVLNAITWRKGHGWAKRQEKEALRCFFQTSEKIIFAEHFGADNMAKGEAGYVAKCDALRGFVFEPLRAYLVGERDRAGLGNTSAVDVRWKAMRGSKGCMAGHWFNVSQWELPTEQNYEWLRSLAPGFFHRKYESLRAEYESLRRPFAVSAAVPYTDVWDFQAVARYAGKHPCEKPEELAEHIINASSRFGDVVLDCFSGSGTFPAVAVRLGRRALGCDMDPHWADVSKRRCEVSSPTRQTESSKVEKADTPQLNLFGAT